MRTRASLLAPEAGTISKGEAAVGGGDNRIAIIQRISCLVHVFYYSKENLIRRRCRVC